MAHFTEDDLFGELICKSVSPVEKKREAKCYPNTQSTPSHCLRPPTLTPIWPISNSQYHCRFLHLSKVKVSLFVEFYMYYFSLTVSLLSDKILFD